MFLVLFFLLASPCCCSSLWGGCPPHELSALNLFKQHLLDPYHSLASWKGLYCCSWKGITCHRLTGHVVRVDLRNFLFSLSALVRNSSSQIFPALFQLQHLEYLDLSYVDLSPLSIPSHLPSLSTLTHLSLLECGLTGRIPSEIGNMSRLTFLDISYNSELETRQSSSWIRNLRGLEHLGLADVNLTRDVVESVASLPNLTSLVMSDMPGTPLSPLGNLTSLSHLQLVGTYFTLLPFPIWISNLTSLVYLYLSEYNISSSMPSAVLSLPHLSNLILYGNPGLKVNLSSIVQHASQLSSLYIVNSDVGRVIPNSIGNMSSLTALDLSVNNIEGRLPDFMGNMSLLTRLYLSQNNIEGSLPDSMGNMFSLTTLDLSYNNIEGSLPNFIGNLSQLEVLDLSTNSLRGNIPWSSLGGISKLSYLCLGSNQLNGSLPSTFGNLSSLIELDVSNNSLSGTFLLSQLENLTKIYYLSLSNNFLRVKVEDFWIPKFQLQYLYLSSCNMDGDFPSFLSTQYNIRELDLSNNSLGGNIPDWLWGLTSFNTLNLSCNQFGGKLLSSKFGKLNAQYVDLHRNKLQGNVLVPYHDVQFLDMSENQFDGIISENIDDYGQSQLNYLSLANNNISGVFPHSICEGNHLEVLDVSNNKLTGNHPKLDREVNWSSNFGVEI
ncbi:hypothetical protein SUGI_0214420 [Cryptomeria japonica]|nr:hypothetical protein SUGI_0214420 [Cryptomeria japonica]